jgi:uncharacterized protein (UPF0335 family)
MGLVPVSDGHGGTRLEMRTLPPAPAKGKKARIVPDPIEASAEGAAQELKLLIERIERLEEEKRGITDDIRDIYSEGKARGYDAKILRKIVEIRRIDSHDRAEMDAVLDTYKTALGL